MTEVRCSDFDGYLVPCCDACHEDEDEYGFPLALIFELEPELTVEVCCRKSLDLLSKLGLSESRLTRRTDMV